MWWRVVAAAVMDQAAGVASRPLKYSAQVMDSPALACLAKACRHSLARSLLRAVVLVTSEGRGLVMNMGHAYL